MSAEGAILASGGTQWQIILQTALDAVIVMDSSGIIVDWNESASTIFGWQKNEALGRNMAALIIPESLREAHTRGLERFLKSGEKKVIGRRIEISGLHRSGRVFPVELTISPVRDEARLVFVGFLRDVSASKKAESQIRESEERFSKAFNAAAHPMSITTLKDGRYVDINAAGLAASGLALDQVIGRTVRDLGFYNDAENYRKIRKLLATEGRFTNLETTLKGQQGPRTFLLSGALVDLHGESCLLTSAVDITERKQAEDHVQFLMRELNHRANNLLSIVQALAHQTANTADAKAFAERLSQRLISLAASNNLLVSGKWQGVGMAKLIASQLSPFADPGERIALDGPEARLTPAAAQAIGMALHELATNAAKYGALSRDGGHISIRWSADAGEGTPTFTLTWSERDGPAVAAPTRVGFGRSVVERMIAGALGGKASLDFAPDGVVWTFTCPSGNALEGER